MRAEKSNAASSPGLSPVSALPGSFEANGQWRVVALGRGEGVHLLAIGPLPAGPVATKLGPAERLEEVGRRSSFFNVSFSRGTLPQKRVRKGTAGGPSQSKIPRPVTDSLWGTSTSHLEELRSIIFPFVIPLDRRKPGNMRHESSQKGSPQACCAIPELGCSHESCKPAPSHDWSVAPTLAIGHLQHLTALPSSLCPNLASFETYMNQFADPRF